MLDLQPRLDGEPEILPGRRLKASVAGTYAALRGSFVTQPVDTLALTFDGIEGDYHAGPTRRSGSREPWYKRGTVMRNERQLSIVAPDELATIAGRMGLDRVTPEWLGANLLIDGIARLSMLPPGTMLFFKGGVTIKIDAQNHPCRDAGRAIARGAGMTDVEEGSLLFPKVAKRLRGLVGWVEKPGTITPGEDLSVRVPEQWIYRP